MGYIVRMPKLGVEMEQGTVLTWHVGEGEEVGDDQLIAEIESEKTQAEVTAREGGVLRQIVLAEGEDGPPGAAMGVVAGPDEDVADLLAEAGADADAEGDAGGAPASEDPAETTGSTADTGGAEPTTQSDAGGSPAETAAAGDDGKASPRARKRAEELGVDLAGVDGTGPQGSITANDVETAAGVDRASTAGGGGTAPAPEAGGPPVSAAGVQASPRARKRAGELGIGLAGVEGTGPEGSVVEADVERAAEAGTASAGATAGTAAPEPGSGASASAETVQAGAATLTVTEDRKQSQMRKTIARRLGESWREKPHVTVNREINAEPLFAAVDAAKASGHDVSMTDVLLRAVSETLSDHPEFNARFEDDRHRIYEEQNVGVAVDVENGLVTPVIPDVGNKSVDEISAVRRERTDRALSGDFTGDDLSGGTFTVSNLGVFGVDSFTPIINPPEIAILGVNRVRERAVPGERGGIQFQREMSFSLSFDHRVVDGADAAKFLDTLADHLEDAVSLVP